MAITFIRDVITSGYNLSKINSNFEKIQTALQDAVSRTGTGPNQLSADLDMNSNDLINVGNIDADEIKVGGVDLSVRLQDVIDVKDETESFRDEAENFATNASISESNAQASASSASSSAAAALVSKNAAAVSEANAWLASATAGSPLYDSEPNGRAASVNGQVFRVAVAPGVQAWRRDSAGASTFLGWIGEVIFDNVGALTTSAFTGFAMGQIVRTRREGFVYTVAASAATDHDVITLGGVKLYVVPVNGAIHVDAFGAAGNNSSNDIAFFHAAFLAAVRLGGARVCFGRPGAIYRITYTDSHPSLVIGNRTQFEGVCPGSYINVVQSTFPTVPSNPSGRIACYCEIATGNPVNRSRPSPTVLAAPARFVITANLQASDFLEGVEFKNVELRCTYTGGVMTGSQRLSGIQVWFCNRLRMDNVQAYDFPNNGIIVNGGSGHFLTKLRADRCGFNAVSGTTRNGINLTGYMLTEFPELSSADWHVSGIQASYNRDEGIMFATIKGLVIDGATGRGNLDRFIEGDTSFSSPAITSSTYGQEIPLDVIITNVIYDALYSDGVQKGVRGISVACGNEGRVLISNVRLRNVTANGNPQYSADGGTPIFISFNDGGRVRVSHVTIEQAIAQNNFHLISVSAAHVHISDVDIIDCAGAGNSNAVVVNNAVVGKVRNIEITNSPTLVNGVSFGGGRAAVLHSAKDIKAFGLSRSLIVAQSSARVDLIEIMDCVSINSNGANQTDNGLLRIANSAFEAGIVVIRRNLVRNQFVTRYPIAVDGGVTVALGANAIGSLRITENDFGLRQFGFNFTLNRSTSVDLSPDSIDFRNQREGQREVQASSLPTTGTWNAGDEVRNPQTGAGGVHVWRCTASGVFGTLTGVTGTGSSASATLTVNDATNINVNDTISIVGISGSRRVVLKSGNVLTLASNLGADVTGAAVSYTAPAFRAISLPA